MLRALRPAAPSVRQVSITSLQCTSCWSLSADRLASRTTAELPCHDPTTSWPEHHARRRAGEANADGRILGYPTFETWIGAFG